ncbi:MAG: FIVAR domain-containing protein [Oscillospiraceae bacterium]|jgi:hypothetical protein|nr:FIVAR domain-containing protein [Oscillospiraceae bacterium]
MKFFRKGLCVFFAVLFVLGSIGVAGASAETINYGIRRTSPGESVMGESGFEYAIFKFEATVPVEKVITDYRWTVTEASTSVITDAYNETVDNVIYYDTGVSATIPGSNGRTEDRNKLTINLSAGDYFVSFRCVNVGTHEEIVYAPMLFKIKEPADKNALKNLYEKVALFKTEIKYTPESWANFKDVRDRAKAAIGNYDLEQTAVNAMLTELQTAIDDLVLANDGQKGSFASFFMLLVEIVQYILFIKRDKDLSELFAELKNSLFQPK